VRPTDETLSWLRRVVGQQIHLYEDGVLAATSQPEVFDSGLLGLRLPGEIDRALVREGRPTFVRYETWGRLPLTVAYARVDVRGGPRNAVLAVPLVVEPRQTDRAVDRLVDQGEDADGDRRAGMGIARCDESAVRRDDADWVARLHRVESGGDGAGEDPRMPGAHRRIPTWLQGERPHRALLGRSHYDSPARR